MIISASRRTDIPAFYADWLMNRIREGFVLVRNPRNHHQVSRISLLPSDVECFVFWTKNPQSFLGTLPALSKYNYYFQFTLTPYDQQLEAQVPAKESVLAIFKKLSSLIGKRRVIWRYDPILITESMSVEWHQTRFAYLAKELAGFTDQCVISFLDSYKKCEKNLSTLKLSELTPQLMGRLARGLAGIAARHNIAVLGCAEEIDLTACGVSHGKCVDDKLIAELAGCDVVATKDKTQRIDCGCIASVDIGAYNSCPHGCLYCYANCDVSAVKHNYAQHDPESPLLLGAVGKEDRITTRKAFSCFAVSKKCLNSSSVSLEM